MDPQHEDLNGNLQQGPSLSDTQVNQSAPILTPGFSLLAIQFDPVEDDPEPGEVGQKREGARLQLLNTKGARVEEQPSVRPIRAKQTVSAKRWKPIEIRDRGLRIRSIKSSQSKNPEPPAENSHQTSAMQHSSTSNGGRSNGVPAHQTFTFSARPAQHPQPQMQQPQMQQPQMQQPQMQQPQMQQPQMQQPQMPCPQMQPYPQTQPYPQMPFISPYGTLFFPPPMYPQGLYPPQPPPNPPTDHMNSTHSLDGLRSSSQIASDVLPMDTQSTLEETSPDSQMSLIQPQLSTETMANMESESGETVSQFEGTLEDHEQHRGTVLGDEDVDMAPNAASKGKERAQFAGATEDHSASGQSTESAFGQGPGASFATLLLNQFQQMNDNLYQQMKQNETILQSVGQMHERFKGVEETLGDIGIRGLASSRARKRERGGVVTQSDDKQEESTVEDVVEGARSRQKPSKKLKLMMGDGNSETDEINKLKAVVRDHLATLIGYKELKQLLKLCPPLSEDEEQAFSEGTDDAPTITARRFRVDFEHKWKSFPFNIEARSFFITHVIKALKGGSYADRAIPPELCTKAHIGNALDSHMSYLRAQYKEVQKPEPEQKATSITYRGRMATNQRRVTLRNTRIRALERRGLKDKLKLFTKLDNTHMSDDEYEKLGPTKRHPALFNSIRPIWRSQALGEFLHDLDDAHREDWAAPAGNRATPGNPPRTRVEAEGRVGSGPVPRRLWRNCYDAEWLKKQRPHFVADLEIIDKDFDFSLPLM